jgi:eukaryotic-like serine/threonine-protein kinase
MALTAGVRLGPYEILSAIGAGGMGEVWKARDTTLGRDVALKILPDHLALDADRLARFKREAQILASLNHPNIATIYGFQESDGLQALVLELVEGPTLADRIAQRPIPLEDALPIARQIAEALEAAHEQGIVHRDLKPANIKLRADGTVKVLDFGLAKAMEPTEAIAPFGLSTSPTVTSPAMTHAGVILGTAAYMSPEQARGKPVDRRTDIWAFGCVLYEMLTSRKPYGRGTVSDTIAAILEREPDWVALPAGTFPAIDRLLRRCLEKDPKSRLRDIGDARLELGDETPPLVDKAPAVSRWLQTLGALAVGLMLGAMTVYGIIRARTVPPTEAPIRFTFGAPEEGLQLLGTPAPSPDGRQIAFIAQNAAGADSLWIRSMDSSTLRRIDGTEGAVSPFWSPDSEFVGFGVPSEGRLKKVDLSGGYVQNISRISDANPGSTWNAEGVIVFSGDNRVPLLRVSASGGTPQPVTVLDSTRRENSHRYPHFLPDGRHFLYTARSDVRENTGIYVGVLDSKDRTWLVEAQSRAVYAPPGYLLFVREGTLLAQRFDAATLELSGEPIALAGNVAQNATGAQASFSASANGRVLTYLTSQTTASQLMWFNRDGTKRDPTGVEGVFEQMRLAPDGKRAAVVTADRDSGNRDIWLVNLTDGNLTRFTSHPANDWNPAWSPDGTEIAFASDRNGLSTVYRKASDSSGAEELVPTSSVTGNIFSDDWSSEGGWLAAHVSTPTTLLDVWVLSLTGADRSYPLAQTRFQEQTPSFSPNERWIAYVSDESGTPEVYVQTLGETGRQRVSTAGGMYPRWRRDGRELFFVDASGRFTAVAVGAGDTFAGSPPVALFNACGPPGGPFPNRYDIAADGNRSLWLCPTPRTAPSLANVFVDWAAQLEGRR